MSRLSLSLVVLLVACGGNRAAQPRTVTPTLDADAAPLPLWPAVRRGKLENGLTYYVMRHSKPEKRALLWLAVNAGSVQEDDDQRGLAHFDEHMAFNGTRRFPKNAIVDYLEKIGMRYGADLNAYTGWDQTVYQLEVPSDDGKYLGNGLDILRDWAGDVSYEPGEVDKERGVIKEEWRLGRGAMARISDQHAKVLFAGTRYADRLPIGQPEVFERAAAGVLARYYRDWYRPELMAVIAVGDFDPDQIEREIRARFSDLKAPKQVRLRPAGGKPPAAGTRVSIATDAELPVTALTVSNVVPHRPSSSRRDYRRATGEQLYTLILNERLGVLARRPDAPFLGAGGSIHNLVRDLDAFERFAVIKGGKVEDALRTLLTEVVRIERHGITPSELERARANMARQYEQLAATQETEHASALADEITRNYFVAESMIGGAAERAMTLQLLPTLQVADLNAIVRTFAGADGRVIELSAPTSAKLPSKERLLAIVAEVERAELSAWTDAAAKDPLMARPPTPGKIVRERKLAAVGVTEWTLGNGVRVVVKPTDFEKDALLLRGNAPGGEATASEAEQLDARFASQAAQVGGVGTLDIEALGKVLTGKHVQVTVGIGEVSDGIIANGSARDVETMLQLVHLRMTAPRRDPQAWQTYRQNFAEQLTELRRMPEQAFNLDVRDELWGHHARKRLPTPDEVRAADLDRALAFYRSRFGDASGFTFVIVGAVELDRLRPLVETYLASLPATGRVEKERDLHIRRKPSTVRRVWRLGQEPKAQVRLEFFADEPWTLDKERDLNILGQVLDMRLREVLREDLGGVYGVGAHGHMQRAPFGERSFSISFGCDPARVDELVAATNSEIDKLARDGAPAAVMEKLRARFVRGRELDLRKNGFWAGWLDEAYRYGDDPTIILDPSGLLARMTSQRVAEAARHYLDRRRTFEAVLLPAK